MSIYCIKGLLYKSNLKLIFLVGQLNFCIRTLMHSYSARVMRSFSARVKVLDFNISANFTFLLFVIFYLNVYHFDYNYIVK